MKPEIIPGYTIRERIGAGGYGEVWKADAPGGLVKAVKLSMAAWKGNAPAANSRRSTASRKSAIRSSSPWNASR